MVGIFKPATADEEPGIWPVAIGIILRRLVYILVLTVACPQASGYLQPHQISQVMAAGTEVLIHGLLHVVTQHHLDPGKALLRADGHNAFNEVERNGFMKQVCVHAGAAAQLTHALYGTQSFLVAGDTLLRSAQGAQKGDPLGMLLFALAIQPLIDTINEDCKLDFNVWCANDGKIVGNIIEVERVYEILLREGPKYNSKLAELGWFSDLRVVASLLPFTRSLEEERQSQTNTSFALPFSCVRRHSDPNHDRRGTFRLK
eukprot:Plantae.Rhodophyta-Palmaria_palmata.ctg6422.p1 GENE.Plantae.Rhodophyta-Palmaria_palmata.ctg6422~~Plantae.Rhodophyta-Palmaria_palmata.ctg6422.p1  ORF type:complete len:280 (+),score=16.51 Plantae.Rhodophyta-Palmaria_palmata.ctg6422:65-841(+)